MTLPFDKPEDVLSFALGAARHGRCALGVVTETTGGGVRAPGALFAVNGEGRMAGYVSNGCVDADIRAQACLALEDGQNRLLRYGEGSPYADLRLPCGGAVEVLLQPGPDPLVIEEALSALLARQPANLTFAPDERLGTERFTAHLTPRRRLRIVGRGAEPVALAGSALAAGFAVECWSPDDDVLGAAEALGAAPVTRLSTPEALPPATDDPWTAVAFLFHDHDWEPALLEQALGGTAFYVGALGSRRAQAARREALTARGVPADRIARLRGPIGLVPSLRDAPSIAISILAEVVAAMQDRPT